MPPYLTAHGINAMVHAIEAYSGRLPSTSRRSLVCACHSTGRRSLWDGGTFVPLEE
ncbi:hypothetical protein [Rhizobium leguminosarum]|uniref:hypothetical protein n=1 Tax=Rhizobium leguminosarum TaxID=384 RepID=UPI0028F43951|nr:hypothetical protein [Rhizobium leguminosarum]